MRENIIKALLFGLLLATPALSAPNSYGPPGNGVNLAAPGPIGGTTPAAGNFTSGSFTSITVTGNIPELMGSKAVTKSTNVNFLQISVPDGTSGACLISASTTSDAAVGYAVDYHLMSVVFGNWTGSMMPPAVTASNNVQGTFNSSVLLLTSSFGAANGTNLVNVSVNVSATGTASSSVGAPILRWKASCPGVNVILTAL